MKPQQKLETAFRRLASRSPEWLIRAPGRVNLIGEHVDYNDGWVLPIALELAVWLAAAPVPSPTVTIHALDLDNIVSFPLDELESKKDVAGLPLPTWAQYPAGVAWELRDIGLPVTGLETVFTSTVPIGAGLASSAAIEVAFALAWQAIGGWDLEPMAMAKLCQRAENAYVGVQCGLMDQFACLHGRAGHALLLDCRTLDWETMPLPHDYRLVITDSAVRRSLENSAYNDRRASCDEAVEILALRLPAVHALRDVSVADLERHASVLPTVTRMRAEHVVKECARVRLAARCLKHGDLSELGALLHQGHASLRDLYEVSTPELDILVEIAGDLPGCLGSRLSGAGFGGCTVSLVHEANAREFATTLKVEYLRRTGLQATCWICRGDRGAYAVKWEPPNSSPQAG